MRLTAPTFMAPALALPTTPPVKIRADLTALAGNHGTTSAVVDREGQYNAARFVKAEASAAER